LNDLPSFQQIILPPEAMQCSRAVCQVRGLATVRRCYAEGGDDLCQVVVVVVVVVVVEVVVVVVVVA
jgi:hypothetical protein